MTTPDLPDRKYQIIGTDDNGNTLYRPAHPYMGLDGTERFETFRTWFVGEDGRTSIERERDELREKLEEINQIANDMYEVAHDSQLWADSVRRAYDDVDDDAVAIMKLSTQQGPNQ